MKIKIFLIIIILIILSSVFYWFQWRPSEIRKECANEARMFETKTLNDNIYEDCLKLRGLDK